MAGTLVALLVLIGAGVGIQQWRAQTRRGNVGASRGVTRRGPAPPTSCRFCNNGSGRAILAKNL